MAVKHRRINIIQAILKKLDNGGYNSPNSPFGLLLRKKTICGETILDYALSLGETQCALIFIKKASLCILDEKTLEKAIQLRSLELIKEHLDLRRQHFLDIAQEKLSTEMLKIQKEDSEDNSLALILINAGAKFDYPYLSSKDYKTSFMLAMEKGCITLVKAMIQKALSISKDNLQKILKETNNEGYGPLDFALTNQHHECAIELLEAADGQLDSIGLKAAIQHNSVKVINNIAERLRKTNNLELFDQENFFYVLTPLQMAITLGRKEAVVILIKAGAKVNQPELTMMLNIETQLYMAAVQAISEKDRLEKSTNVVPTALPEAAPPKEESAEKGNSSPSANVGPIETHVNQKHQQVRIPMFRHEKLELLFG